MFVFISWLVTQEVCIHIQYFFGIVRNKLYLLELIKRRPKVQEKMAWQNMAFKLISFFRQIAQWLEHSCTVSTRSWIQIPLSQLPIWNQKTLAHDEYCIYIWSHSHQKEKIQNYVFFISKHHKMIKIMWLIEKTNLSETMILWICERSM